VRIAAAMVWLGAGLLLAQQPTDVRGWMNQGVQAFRTGQYQQATEAFQKAVDLDPSNLAAHLYLGTAFMQQFVPGAATAQSQDFAARAEFEFQRVLALDATNQVALASLASLSLNQRKWAEARDWYHRVLSSDANNAQAYYSLGFVAWSEWYPPYSAARARAGLRPEDPGPLPEGSAKQDLRNRYEPTIEDGIADLKRALEINPKYDDAMAYLNLLIRERADLRSTREEYLRDVAEADQWVQKALETKKEKAQQAGMAGMTGGSAGGRPPGRIIIGGNIQQSRLVLRVNPEYPPSARQAGIQGVVQLSVVIARDGTVSNISVRDGHPLLVPAAIGAVKQWRYRTTTLNGEPVEVQTTVDVNFTLSQ
jgi:TonB family protein